MKRRHPRWLTKASRTTPWQLLGAKRQPLAIKQSDGGDNSATPVR
jgi:hypothetical protein